MFDESSRSRPRPGSSAPLFLAGRLRDLVDSAGDDAEGPGDPPFAMLAMLPENGSAVAGATGVISGIVSIGIGCGSSPLDFAGLPSPVTEREGAISVVDPGDPLV